MRSMKSYEADTAQDVYVYRPNSGCLVVTCVAVATWLRADNAAHKVVRRGRMLQSHTGVTGNILHVFIMLVALWSIMVYVLYALE